MRKGVVVYFLLCFSLVCQGQFWEISYVGNTEGMFAFGSKTYVTYEGQLLISDNEGVWTKSDYPEALNNPFPIFFDEQNGLLASRINEDNADAPFAMTTDGGQTWEVFTPLITGSTGFIPFRLKVVDEQTVVGRRRGQFLISYDRGRTWEAKLAPFSGDVSTFETFGRDLWYAQSNGEGMFKSTDQGDTWEQLQDEPMESFFMKSPTLGYALNVSVADPDVPFTLFKTTDGWQSMESFPFEIPEDNWIHVFHVTDDEGFGFFVRNRFYYINDIHDPDVEFKVVQDLELIEPGSMQRFGGSVFVNSSRALLKLNPDKAAIPIEDVVTSLVEANAPDVNVYPNPALDYIEVSRPGYEQFELIDISGTLVLKGSIDDQRIDLTTVIRGVYIIRLTDAQSVLAAKSIRLQKK